ncbi:MAG: ECF transporter S component, partial [[Clostridium] nexile]
MGQSSTINLKTIVTVGFFAAVTFLGIQMFRIPLPAAVGTPFVHFGHIFVVLGVLLQGGKKGAISGTIGLV